MQITFERDLYIACQSVLTRAPFNMSENVDRWFKATGFSITRFEPKDLKRLRDEVAEHTSCKGARGVVRDIDIWLKAGEEGGLATTKARNIRTGMALVIQYLAKTPRKHVYKQEQDGIENVMLCYYVENIKYTERRKDNHGNIYPEHFTIYMWYERYGEAQQSQTSFYPEDVLGLNAYKILTKGGLLPETDELREAYETQFEDWHKYYQQYGLQFLAVGAAKERDGDEDRWWRRSDKTLKADKDGVPTRVVVDVFVEDDTEEKKSKNERPSPYFWERNKNKVRDEDEEECDELGEDNDENQKDIPEVPLHPYMVCFDLKRHKRLNIHIGNLTKYEYNTELRTQLILPEDCSALIDTLLGEATGKFKDVIGGKTGGVIVLCQGAPGTGKTLTAEVYSEALQRPLYTVQCSQLGTDEEKLEENLLKVLARGRRWNAIMLLDEADVYVHKRGNDLTQNAIVGVFLRVLEYHSGTLFLTTNRGDLVDDAILSRCTARIPYVTPTPENQIKIWRVLSDANDVDLNLAQIKEIVQRNPKASGRDVKNLLKLAMLMAANNGGGITPDLIDKARAFKPTVE